MIINLAKNITRRSQDTTPIPDIVIARVNKLSYNEPNQFIFTDCRGFPIGDVDITRVVMIWAVSEPQTRYTMTSRH